MNETDYIPIAALNQYAYCPHRCWRMFCAGEFVDNQYTIEGTMLHARVHTPGEGHREEREQIRAIWLKSERYQLIGKSDLIELESGQLYPVEYKRGHKGEWDNDEMQVCAQALCLEEMTGKSITTGYIYYANSYQRQLVDISTELRQEMLTTLAAVTRTKNIFVRQAQWQAIGESEKAIHVVKGFVRGKLKNYRVMLHRSQRKHPELQLSEAISGLDRAIAPINQTNSINSLRGLEGAGSAAYFGAFNQLLRITSFTFEASHPHQEVVATSERLATKGFLPFLSLRFC